MTINLFLIYFGAASLALLLLYSTKNYWITFFAGFIVFCVFYFSFSTDNFEWKINFMLQLLKEAAVIYIISFVLAVLFYKIVPLKKRTVISE